MMTRLTPSYVWLDIQAAALAHFGDPDAEPQNQVPITKCADLPNSSA